MVLFFIKFFFLVLVFTRSVLIVGALLNINTNYDLLSYGPSPDGVTQYYKEVCVKDASVSIFYWKGAELEILEKLGEGGNGIVYKVKCAGNEYALKLDKGIHGSGFGDNALDKEHQVLEWLETSKPNTEIEGSDTVGFPKSYGVGAIKVNEKYHQCLLMELLGRTAENKRREIKPTDKRSKASQLYDLADHMMLALNVLHSKGVIHRDVKWDNFVFGRKEKENILYIVDFATSVCKGIIFEPRDVGCFEYMSINAQENLLTLVGTQPLDDYVSYAYIWIHALNPNALDWKGFCRNELMHEYNKDGSLLTKLSRPAVQNLLVKLRDRKKTFQFSTLPNLFVGDYEKFGIVFRTILNFDLGKSFRTILRNGRQGLANAWNLANA